MKNIFYIFLLGLPTLGFAMEGQQDVSDKELWEEIIPFSGYEEDYITKTGKNFTKCTKPSVRPRVERYVITLANGAQKIRFGSRIKNQATKQLRQNRLERMTKRASEVIERLNALEDEAFLRESGKKRKTPPSIKQSRANAKAKKRRILSDDNMQENVFLNSLNRLCKGLGISCDESASCEPELPELVPSEGLLSQIRDLTESALHDGIQPLGSDALSDDTLKDSNDDL